MRDSKNLTRAEEADWNLLVEEIWYPLYTLVWTSVEDPTFDLAWELLYEK